MKKVLSTVLAASIVVSSFAGAAFAAEAPANTQEKYDILNTLKIFEGDENGANLGGDMTRAQLAKIITLVKGLQEDAAAADYSDLDGAAWAKGYIGAVTKAGIFEGVDDVAKKFDPSGKVTLEQLAKVLVKVLGLNEGTDAVSGKVSDWAKGYVAAAVKAGVLTASDFTVNATRGQFVDATYGVVTQVQAALTVTSAKAVDANTVEFTLSTGAVVTQKLETALVANTETEVSTTFLGKTLTAKVTLAVQTDVAVKAVGAKKFEVTFGAAVDSSKVVIAVKNGTNVVNTKSVTYSEDKKTATVEFPYALAAAEYTVTVTGASDKEVTSTVKVEAEKVSKVEFTSDKAVLDRADKTLVKVGYKVLNQYNENITSSTSLTATTSAGTIVGGNTVSGGTITIDNGTTDFTVNNPIAVSLIHTNGTFVSATVSVAAAANVSAVEIKSLFQDNTTKSDLQVGKSTVGQYYLVLDAKDQYGNSVTDAATLASDLLVTVSNTAVVSVNGYASNAATFATKSIDGSNKAVLQLAGGLTAGTSNITLISKSTGAKSSFDVVVKDAVKVDSFTMTAPALAVAGEDTVIPFTAVDQFGAAVDHPADASFTSVNTTSGTVVFEKDVVANKTNMKLRNPAKGTVIITVVTKTNKVQQLTVNVVDAKVPTVVSGIKDFSTSMLKTGTVTIGKANIVVKDQYGRDMTPNWGDGVVAPAGAPEYRVVVESGSASNVTVTGNTYVTDTGTVVLTGAAKGSSTVTLKLEKATETAAFAAVANSSFTYSQNVVENADIASYEATVSGDVYNNGGATYGKDLVVKGLLADGSKVTVPNDAANYDVISSNAAVVYTRGTNAAAAGKITAVNYAFNGTETSADAVVTVVVKGTTTVSIPVTVKVSKATPAIQTLSLKDTFAGTNGQVKKESDGVISAYAADVNTIGGLEAVVEGIVKSVDQYGLEVAEDFDQANVIVSNLSVAAATKTQANVATGDSFNVTAIIGAKVVSFKVIVK